MLLAVPGMVPVDTLILGKIALVAGSGAVVNHLIDRKIDVVMSAPITDQPSWADDPLQAGIFAAVISAGMAIMMIWVTAANTLASSLGMPSFTPVI